MSHGNKQAESDEASGAPEWMVTFSDCMTLLLTFFVLLLSFSSFDEKIFQKLQMILARSMSDISEPEEKNKDAFLPTSQIEETPELDEGSEKPTLERGYVDTLKKETAPRDFRRHKVFFISSEEVFWGNGEFLSSEGRSVMSKVASFLKEMPGRVVISEGDSSGNKDNQKLGLLRAWTVMDYITTVHSLDRKWFSISAEATVNRENLGSEKSNLVAERVLEIALLERSIYD